jgi:hypothetical protein
MSANRFVSFVIAGLAMVSTRPTFGSLIFDNTAAGPSRILSFTALQQGDTVKSAGTDRLVTDLQIAVTQQGTPGTSDMKARLYANDGAHGNPGTLLWSSALRTNVHLSGAVEFVDFSVPSVLVPDVFTWTIQISNTSPVAVGLPSFGPANVGTLLSNGFGTPPGWTLLSNSYGARISAASATVPLPTSLVGFALGLPCLGLWFFAFRTNGAGI